MQQVLKLLDPQIARGYHGIYSQLQLLDQQLKRLRNKRHYLNQRLLRDYEEVWLVAKDPIIAFRILSNIPSKLQCLLSQSSTL